MRAYQDRYKCIPLIKTQTQKWNKLNRWRQIFTRKCSLSLFFSTRCIFGFTRMTVSRGRSSRVPRLPHRKQEMAVGWWRLFLSGHSISDCLRYIRWRIECWPFLGLFSSSGCIFCVTEYWWSFVAVRWGPSFAFSCCSIERKETGRRTKEVCRWWYSCRLSYNVLFDTPENQKKKIRDR